MSSLKIITNLFLSFLFVILLNFLIFNNSYALDTSSKTWGDLTITGQLFNLPNLNYILEDQPRYDNSQNQFQRNVAKTGLGYTVAPNINVWLGYQNNSDDLISNAEQQNRIWEQLVWDIADQKDYDFVSQTLLDQTYQVAQTGWNDRFRQKLTLRLPNKLFDKYDPVFSDEIFVNLTRPDWVSTRVLNQNRAFIGVDIPVSKNTYVEVGYMNQYLFEESTANQMNNILYLGYFINT